jgi:hypothetical protein
MSMRRERVEVSDCSFGQIICLGSCECSTYFFKVSCRNTNLPRIPLRNCWEYEEGRNTEFLCYCTDLDFKEL